jgi:hypothetical protein
MLGKGYEKIKSKSLRRVQMMEVAMQPQGVDNLVLHDFRSERLEDIQPFQISRQYVTVGAFHPISYKHSALDAAESSAPVVIEMRLESLVVGLL